jgi:hypothetical protein
MSRTGRKIVAGGSILTLMIENNKEFPPVLYLDMAYPHKLPTSTLIKAEERPIIRVLRNAYCPPFSHHIKA